MATPYSYSMRITQALGGGYRITVTRSLSDWNPFTGVRQRQSETRTYTTAKRPLTAQGAWNAAERAAADKHRRVIDAQLRAQRVAAMIAVRCEDCGAAPGVGCDRAADTTSALVLLDPATVGHAGRLADAVGAGMIRLNEVLVQFGKNELPAELAELAAARPWPRLLNRLTPRWLARWRATTSPAARAPMAPPGTPPLTAQQGRILAAVQAADRHVYTGRARPGHRPAGAGGPSHR
jgi:hypothetical protein